MGKRIFGGGVEFRKLFLKKFLPWMPLVEMFFKIFFYRKRFQKFYKIFFVGSTSVKPIIKNNLKFFNSVAIELQIFFDRPRD